MLLRPCCVFLAGLSLLCAGQALLIEYPQTSWTVKAIAGLEKTVDFFDKHYAEINLDGLYGLRVAEGQIVDAVRYVFRQSTPSLDLTLLPRLLDLRERIRVAAEKCFLILEEIGGDYFHAFRNTINKPYRVPYLARTVHPVVLQGNLSARYIETQGDACFAEMLGTSTPADGSPPPPKCTVGDDCLYQMTRRGVKAYAITHQLLFFIQTLNAGCNSTIDSIFGPGGLEKFQEDICDQVFSEASLEAAGENVPPFYQDLFLEQCMLCGIVGFADFVQTRWLQMVLDWQSPSGCFTDSILLASRPGGRRLLYEKVLPDGCLSHKTGLGAGFLGLYVRHLLETGSDMV